MSRKLHPKVEEALARFRAKSEQIKNGTYNGGIEPTPSPEPTTEPADYRPTETTTDPDSRELFGI